MGGEIDITGLDKAELLAALFNASRQQGLGLFDPRGHSPMTVETARECLDQTPSKYFDYLFGRVLKVDLSTNSLRPWLYDRDNGPGATLAVVNSLRKPCR